MVIGEDFISERFVQEIKNNPSAGYRIVKQLANPEVSEVKMSISNPGVDEVILANPNYPAEEILQIIDFCNELNPIYAEDRYPDYSDIIPAKKFQEEEIRGFLNKSKEVLKWTKENLKSLESSKNSKKKTKSKK